MISNVNNCELYDAPPLGKGILQLAQGAPRLVDGPFDLERLRFLLGCCAMVQMVPVMDDDEWREDELVLWMDEDAQNKQLPVNVEATSVYGEHVCGNTIAGPLLVINLADCI
ncbi:hypothetical protein CYMTET_40927 [Cymbomonas tetramitiformis]|uniref:Uncharacterized protein n=1 Tax=Cymbomonas tetramitiformis TaxID=36881 RepID=A0AAE0C761_9CHLO|nr:hypothetical protein CYMTET_40927 [Cymbomonas tetramitiformis]|eukprot:gene226-402_t